MIKNFKDFFKNRDIVDNDYNQDELDAMLFDAINTNNHKMFVNLINKGANINVDKNEFGRKNTPLIQCLYGWSHDDKSRVKFLKTLFNNKVDVFDNEVKGGSGETFRFNIIKFINKLVDKKYRAELIDYLWSKYPNYEEDMKIQKNINKYNL